MSGENDKQKKQEEEERRRQIDEQIRADAIAATKKKNEEWEKTQNERKKLEEERNAQREAERAERAARALAESIRHTMRWSAVATVCTHEGFSQVSIFDAMSRNRTTPEHFELGKGMCRGLSLLWLTDCIKGEKSFKSVVNGATSEDRRLVERNIQSITDLHRMTDDSFAKRFDLIHDPNADVWSAVAKLVGPNDVHLGIFIKTPGYYIFHISGKGDHAMAAYTDSLGVTRFFDPNGGFVSGLLGLGLFFEAFLRSKVIDGLYWHQSAPLKVTRLRESPKKKPEKKPEKKP